MLFSKKVPPFAVRLISFFLAFLGSFFLIRYFPSLSASSFFVFLSFFAVFMAFVSTRPESPVFLAALILSCLFVVSIVFGYSYDQIDSYGFIFKSRATLFTAIGAILSLAFFTTCFLSCVLSGLLRSVPEGSLHIKPRAYFLFVFIVLCLGSIPYLILYWPGLNIYDTHDQILQFFGYPSYIGDGSALSDHHPVFLTCIYGLFMQAGLALGSATLGQILYSILSLTAVSLGFAVLLTYLYTHGMPLSLGISMALFLAIWPVTATYAFNMCKDVSAVPLLLLYLTAMLCIHFSDGTCFTSKPYSVSFILISFLLMIVRKSAFPALLFSAFFLFMAYKAVRPRILLSSGISIALFLIYSMVLLPILGVLPGETHEMLSIPFQQTARYFNEYPEDISEEEKTAVSSVLSLDSFNDYDPRLSDAVKDRSNPDASRSDYIAYFKTWGRMGIRHPGVYLDAWLNMIYGYFYPSESNTVLCLTLNSPDVDSLVLTQNPALSDARLSFYNTVYYVLRRLPVLGILFYVPFITWAFFVLLAALALKYGFRCIAPWSFFIGTFIICLFSPKSGEIRYIFPLLYALPAMLGLLQTGKESSIGSIQNPSKR